jgi:hypothetical protein
VLAAGLVRTACAAGKNAAPSASSASGTVVSRCEALVESLDCARKPTAGRVVGAVALVPVGIGLGAILAVLGRPDGLVALHYGRTLAALEARRGPDHPDLIDTLEPYARLLRALGRDVEAEQLEARRDAIRFAAMAVEVDGAPEEPCDD